MMDSPQQQQQQRRDNSSDGGEETQEPPGANDSMDLDDSQSDSPTAEQATVSFDIPMDKEDGEGVNNINDGDETRDYQDEDENDDDDDASGSDNDIGSGSDDGDDDDDDDDDESSSSSSSSGSDSSSEDEVAADASQQIVDEDGRALSQYEILRLERIKRNKEYLANLGLEGKGDGGGVLGRKKKKPRPPRKKAAPPVAAAVPRPSRRAKKEVNYLEPKTSVKAMLHDSQKNKKEDKAKKKEEKKKKKKEEEEAKDNDDDDATSNNKKKKRSHGERMEKFLYLEFKGIQKHKNEVLKQVKRVVRAAEKEVKYWGKMAEKAEIRQQKREQKEAEAAYEAKYEAERASVRVKEQKEQLGCTIKQLLNEVDRRTPELVEAASRYDTELQAVAKDQELEHKRLESEHKLKTIDALDWFHKASDDYESLLNNVLMERAPDDPPPPRRSRRSGAHHDQVESPPKPPSPKKKKVLKRSNNFESFPQSFDLSIDPFLSDRLSSNNYHQPETTGSTSIRNAGGWISPDFAKMIDRSWLDRDAPLQTFDAGTYVPQIGECVLYYPTGHKEFLRRFPDELGRKNGIRSRVPLWERTLVDRCQSLEPWCTEEWCASIENDSAIYPILCIVQNCLPEFPPDPFSKVQKVGPTSVKVVWKAKDPSTLQKLRGTPLRLAVELCPLTPVLPPKKGEDLQALPVPPTFTVVTFPSSQVKPFLIPFSWAYSINHSIAIDEKVTFIDDGVICKGRMSGFADEAQCYRFEENLDELKNFLSASRRLSTEQLLENVPKAFPLRDAHVVLNILRCFCDGRDTLKQPESNGCVERNFDLFAFVQNTFPTWKSFKTLKDVYSRKALYLSPWDVTSKASLRISPDALALASNSLDECLRIKLDSAIEDFAEDHPECDDFYYPITNDDVADYYCAVPITMYVEKILRRLRTPSRQKHSYYRGVESLVSDIGMILENCFLYNSADSEVAVTAVRVVEDLKDTVFRVARSHFRELSEVKKADKERRRLVTSTPFVLMGFDSNGENTPPTAIAPILNSIRNPFKGKLNRDWLQATKQEKEMAWIPQCGDTVLYSRERHSAFVKSHYGSLEPYQCCIPPLFDSANTEDSWVPGTIVWTSSAFPKTTMSNKNGEHAGTFLTPSSLLALGVKFGKQDGIITIYWRPCLFVCDELADTTCPTCGLSSDSSFLRLDMGNSGDPMPELPLASIERCLSLLKRKCIRNEPQSLDPELTIANVRKGYTAPMTKFGLKALPSFENALSRTDENAIEHANNKVGTRGISTTREFDSSSPQLVDSGFLPQWVSTSIASSSEKLAIHESFSPWPKLSLELVLLRVKNGYYRSISAIENDIVEAYVASVFLLLSEAAGRKKSPISLKRVTRLLLTRDADATLVDSEEYDEWASNIRRIRGLHSMALLSVTRPAHMERLMGLSILPWKQHSPEIDNVDEDPIRSEARQTIKLLFAAIGKDQKQNNAGSSRPKTASAPTVKIKLKVEGELVSNASYLKRQTYNIAEHNGMTVKVTAIVGGKIISKLKTISSESGLSGDGSTDNTSGPNHLVRVKFKCRGKKMKCQDQISAEASVSHVLGDKSVIRMVDESISLRRADYDGSDTLSRFLFGRPGKTNPCARCQANKRSLFYCRKKLGHSNVDFDWIATFKNRNGVDGVLQALHPDEQAKPDGSGVVENGALDKDEAVEPDEQEPIEESKDEAKDEDKYAEYVGFAEKARTGLAVATALHKEALSYAEAPVRFSKDFIKSAFPVDQDDGHYVYCIICGLSGNLLCCDGCPNVFHSKCAGLQEIPEGDFFCEECAVSRPPGGDPPNNGTANSDTPSVPTSTIPSPLPYGRVDFDEDKMASTNSFLEELNAARPENKRLNTQPDGSAAGDESAPPPGVAENESDASDQSDDEESETEERPRKRAKNAKKARQLNVPVPPEHYEDLMLLEVVKNNKNNDERVDGRWQETHVALLDDGDEDEEESPSAAASEPTSNSNKRLRRTMVMYDDMHASSPPILLKRRMIGQLQHHRHSTTTAPSFSAESANNTGNGSAVLSVEIGHNVFKDNQPWASVRRAPVRPPGKRAVRLTNFYQPPKPPPS